MALRKLILIISLFSCTANASGELGVVPGVDTNGRQSQKYFFNVYEKLGRNYYINPYYEHTTDFNLKQNYFKLDFNKHVTDKFIIGLGVANTHNNYFDRQEVKANLILKLW